MKAIVKPSLKLSLIVDGRHVQGDFVLDSEWNGLLKLRCDAPIMNIICKKPDRVGNPYDFVSPIFGGTNGVAKMAMIELEVIQHDIALKNCRPVDHE